MQTKIALVTGANRGIGLEVVKTLAYKEFQVFMGVRDLTKGEEVLSSLGPLIKQIQLLAIDVTDLQSIQSCANELKRYSDHVDVLINNAAILDKNDIAIEQLSAEVMIKTFTTNTLGPLLVTQALLPALLKSEQPRIINVSSGAGLVGRMEHWAPAYSISKAALNAVTVQFATALEGKVAINAVHPGWVRTQMGGPSAVYSVEQGADSILWLATEAPFNLTGKFVRDRNVIPW